MVKLFLVFLVTWLLVSSGVAVWQQLTDKEKWSTIKVLGRSTVITIAVVTLLAGFVLMF